MSAEEIRRILIWCDARAIMYKQAFGKNLTTILEEKGWSKEHASAVFDVSIAMIYLYLSGTNLPEGVHLARIADILGVSIDWLLGRTTVREVNKVPDNNGVLPPEPPA
jgi:transcriptional regulator with XRE-family HTH domain